MAERNGSREYITYRQAQVAREAFQMIGIDPFAVYSRENSGRSGEKPLFIKKVLGRLLHHSAPGSVTVAYGDPIRNGIEQKLIDTFDLSRSEGLYSGDAIRPLRLAGQELALLHAGLEVYVRERADLQPEDYGTLLMGEEMVGRARVAEAMLGQLESASSITG